MEREEREPTGFGGGAGGRNDWDSFEGGTSWPPGVTPVLEELPKWSLLAKVLEEIEEEISVQATVDLSQSSCLSLFCSSTGLTVALRSLQPSPALIPYSLWPRATGPALSSGSTFPPANRSPKATRRPVGR